jgi:hypothetical protein
MSDAYVIEVSGFTAGIVTRETEDSGFNFFSAAPRFNVMEGQHFADPLAAERAARKLAEYGGLPRRSEASYSFKGAGSRPPLIAVLSVGEV